jgi:hypothetical protein
VTDVVKLVVRANAWAVREGRPHNYPHLILEMRDAIIEQAQEIKRLKDAKVVLDGIIGVFGISAADDPVFYAKELVGLVEQYHAAKVAAETKAAEQAQEIERLMAIRPEAIKAEIAVLEAKIIESCARAAEEAPVHYYGTKSRPMIAAAIRAIKP